MATKKSIAALGFGAAAVLLLGIVLGRTFSGPPEGDRGVPRPDQALAGPDGPPDSISAARGAGRWDAAPPAPAVGGGDERGAREPGRADDRSGTGATGKGESAPAPGGGGGAAAGGGGAGGAGQAVEAVEAVEAGTEFRGVVKGSVRVAGTAAAEGAVKLFQVRDQRSYRGRVADGAYRIGGVRPGAYLVSYISGDGEDTLAGSFMLREGQSELTFDLDLEETVEVSGVVEDGATGKPYHFATVQLTRQGAGPSVRQGDGKSVKTDEQGRFTAGGLVRDRYRLHVFAPNCVAIRDEVDLGSGSVGRLRYVVMPSRTTLLLFVRDKEGTTVEGRGWIGLRRVGEKSTTASNLTLSGGEEPTSVKIHVEPGEYEIQFRMVKGRYGPAKRVTISEGENGPFYLRVP